MTISKNFHYQVQANEPSVYVEIYLPKKANLQGILYDTLTTGFKLNDIKNYFRELNKLDNQLRKDRVLQVASPGWTVLREDLTDYEIDQFPRIFFGYSMYEVDGVFLKQTIERQTDSDENYIFVEERTQVIRIIFKYDCATEPQEVINFAKAILRDPLSEIGTFEENYPELAQRITPDVQEALKPLYKWIRYVGWFL